MKSRMINHSELLIKAMVMTLFLAGIGACIVIVQVIMWSSMGVWTPLPLSRLFNGITASWVYNPDSWYGFAKVVQWFFGLPMYGAFILIGILACFAGYMIDKIVDRINEN